MSEIEIEVAFFALLAFAIFSIQMCVFHIQNRKDARLDKIIMHNLVSKANHE